MPVDDPDELDHLLLSQDGVITRAQLEQHGLRPHELTRMLRRRELVRVHRGVFINHTGPPSRQQLAWAAVLHAGRSALFLGSADDPPVEGTIHVAIDQDRRVRPVDGVQIHRVDRLEGKVDWLRSPPRMRYEDNVLALVHRAASDIDVIALLTGAVGSRRTTGKRLRAAFDRRTRTTRNELVAAVIADLASGTCSVLEHAYLTKVERAHGLPEGSRQVRRRGAKGTEYRDVEYEEYGLDVELDGRAGHAGWEAQARDADRDLDDHAEGRESVRLRWAQVFRTPCRTAERIGCILTRRGWQGELKRCPACPPHSGRKL